MSKGIIIIIAIVTLLIGLTVATTVFMYQRSMVNQPNPARIIDTPQTGTNGQTMPAAPVISQPVEVEVQEIDAVFMEGTGSATYEEESLEQLAQ